MVNELWDARKEGYNLAESINDVQKAWRNKKIVENYATLKWINEPEKYILGMVNPPNWKMLDIGVGTGRTTKHFRYKVSNYIGIDNSPEMIFEAKKMFPDEEYCVMDARDLHFQDELFDFVLFSFNGIDYIPFKDREKCLIEIQRVMKPNGLLAFSSHDIEWLKRIPFKPKLKLFLLNMKPISGSHIDYNVVESGRNLLKTVFIDKSEQKSMLERIGFKDIIMLTQEPSFVYYICKKKFILP